MRPLAEMMAEVKAILTLVAAALAYVVVPLVERSEERNIAHWYPILAINPRYSGKVPQSYRTEGHPYRTQTAGG